MLHVLIYGIGGLIYISRGALNLAVRYTLYIRRSLKRALLLLQVKFRKHQCISIKVGTHRDAAWRHCP